MDAADKLRIKQDYHHGECRDGRGLAGWLESVCRESAAEQQSRQQHLLRQQLKAVLPQGANLRALKQHCSTVLSNWSQVDGNELSHPTDFAWRLIESRA